MAIRLVPPDHMVMVSSNLPDQSALGSDAPSVLSIWAGAEGDRAACALRARLSRWDAWRFGVLSEAVGCRSPAKTQSRQARPRHEATLHPLSATPVRTNWGVLTVCRIRQL